NSPGGLLANPFGGGGRISIRSFLHIFNIKANHRKTIIADKGSEWYAMVSTANPHDASHANRNVGFRFSGVAVADLYHSECAVLKINGVEPSRTGLAIVPQTGDVTVQVVTEGKIKQAVLATITRTQAGDTIDMILFYLAEREVLAALELAHNRGVNIRIVLDPNKDAFGWTKIGIPNRPVAHQLNKQGIAIRWADTHGEQCHSKMLCANFKDQTTTIVLGSANFTRRNLDDFNLEADVVVSGPSDRKALSDANKMFDDVWFNRDERIYTVEYEAYAVTSPFQHLTYWFMETTGISTF
ncbi:MAG: phospholipase D-like domain-containing protein, partial [Pseudomonadales bacterium]